MLTQRQTYFTIVFMLIFSGCAIKETEKTVEIKPNNIEKPIKKEEINKTVIKKTPIKKVVVKRTKVKKIKVKKKPSIYVHCNKHIKIMNHASEYIQEEFNRGYFVQRDIVGAKAQLFLIESNSQSIFSKNINNAIKSYNDEKAIATKNKCNLSKYKITPIEKVKLKIKKLEKYIDKKEEDK